MQRVNAAVSTARQRLGPSLPLTPEQLEMSKAAMLELAAALQGISVDQLLEEGGDAPDLRMGSTCSHILEHMLRTCKELDAPFFVFGAGYWAEVLAAVGHGIRAGGVEIVPRRAAALRDIKFYGNSVFSTQFSTIQFDSFSTPPHMHSATLP